MKEHTMKTLIDIAFEAAKEEAKATVDANPGVWFPCGFANVIIKPARGRLVKMLKEEYDCHLAYGGGLSVYEPGRGSSQWMDGKIAGCKAFIEVLEVHFPELEFTVESRMD